jgi:hypothetical protein
MVVFRLDDGVHTAQKTSHLLDWANRNELYSISVTQNTELLASREMQSLTNGERNNDLKCSLKSNNFHIDMRIVIRRPRRWKPANRLNASNSSLLAVGACYQRPHFRSGQCAE